MFIDLGQGLILSDEKFEAEMARRRAKMKYRPNEVVIGCPLCNGEPIAPRKRPAAPAATAAAAAR